MDKIKLQIKSVFGELLFEWESENNTIKETVEEAIRQSADLTYANLRSANLRSADLRFADLRSANLTYANLTSADLTSADLRYANLTSANLRSANLTYANLTSADLRFAANKELAYLPIFCKWGVSIIGEKIKIGCKEKGIEEWDLWFESKEEFETKRDSEQFKQIQAMYLAYRAYVLHLKQ